MRHIPLFPQTIFLALSIALCACTQKQPSGDAGQDRAETTTVPEAEVHRIAFGSCASQERPQPILAKAASMNPELFIYLGDNIYGDTYVMDTLRAKYARLAAKPEFQRLKSTTHILATWDDHDYGWNDSGRYYPYKEESKEIFLEFFEEPQDSERRQHPGIYHAEYFGSEAQRVQVILLDTRTFRQDLLYCEEGMTDCKNAYRINPSPDSTILGAEQWAWLEAELQQPAKLRIIATSIQFGHEYNGWESWTNVPAERQKMLDLLKKTQAEGAVFISGDVHWSELSEVEEKGLYPIYDMTASGITSTWDKAEPNKNRIGEVYMPNHFGMIEVTWEDDPIINIGSYNVEGEQVIEHEIRLSELTF